MSLETAVRYYLAAGILFVLYLYIKDKDIRKEVEKDPVLCTLFYATFNIIVWPIVALIEFSLTDEEKKELGED